MHRILNIAYPLHAYVRGHIIVIQQTELTLICIIMKTIEQLCPRVKNFLFLIFWLK